MRVSEFASRAGLTAKAVRFYEAEGILPPPSRAENGYREYGDDDLCRARLVVSLRGLGLDLAESGRLAALCRAGECDVMSDQLALRIAERRREVTTKRAELDHLDAELAGLAHALETGEPQVNLCIGKEEDDAAAVRLPMA